MQSITNSFLGFLLVFALFIALYTSSSIVTEQNTNQSVQVPMKVLCQQLIAFKK